MKGRVHSIETFGTVDGPGVRLVVFLSGCPMRCIYCHNPDTWDIHGGTLRDTDEIINEYEKYSEFLTGGITVSGGEPLLQLEFVTELFEKAKEKGIHTCVDTSGVTFSEGKSGEYKKLLSVCDLVMLDIKHIDDNQHRTVTGMSNENILKFAKFVSDNGTELWVRHVVVPGYTDKEEDWYRLGEFLRDIKTVKALDILLYHNMGEEKYRSMGIDYPLSGTIPPDKEVAVRARAAVINGIKGK